MADQSYDSAKLKTKPIPVEEIKSNGTFLLISLDPMNIIHSDYYRRTSH